MLTIDSVSKSLGEFRLSDVSLSVADGEYFIVLGPTGAGKTILLEMIAGIYSPTQGGSSSTARTSRISPHGRGTSAWSTRTTCSSRT
jgi:ABC-type sugar transport system ATPase subunit